jgi:hypothetical protein
MRLYLKKTHHKKGLVEWLKVKVLSLKTSTAKQNTTGKTYSSSLFQRFQSIVVGKAWQSSVTHILAHRERLPTLLLSPFPLFSPSIPPACGMVPLHSGWVFPLANPFWITDIPRSVAY